MRLSLSLFVLFLSFNLHCAVGQENDFIEEKIRSIQPNDKVYYSDKPMMKIVDAFLERTKTGTIISYSGEQLHITNEEKTFLLETLKQQFQETLPDSMFNNSKRIPRDSIAKFVYWENRKLSDFIFRHQHWAFSFTSPVYFRNNQWMVYYFSYYDNSSGEHGLYVCKKINNHWVKWASLGGGAW